VGLVLRRLPKHVQEAVAAGGVVVTGGNALFAGGSDGLNLRWKCLWYEDLFAQQLVVLVYGWVAVSS
jgi:hypothetical protein